MNPEIKRKPDVCTHVIFQQALECYLSLWNYSLSLPFSIYPESCVYPCTVPIVEELWDLGVPYLDSSIQWLYKIWGPQNSVIPVPWQVDIYCPSVDGEMTLRGSPLAKGHGRYRLDVSAQLQCLNNYAGLSVTHETICIVFKHGKF